MSAARSHDPPAAGRPDDDPVVTIRWPEQADLRHAVADAGLPRLLVIAPGVAPPLVWDAREDWVRGGAGPVEVASRSARLGGGPPHRPPAPPRPVLDADGVLHGPDGRIAIVPPIEAALLARLLDHEGRAVRREDLHRAGWPRGGDVRAVDGRVRTLRRRLAGMGMTVHTVRGVGYLLELDHR